MHGGGRVEKVQGTRRKLVGSREEDMDSLGRAQSNEAKERGSMKCVFSPCRFLSFGLQKPALHDIISFLDSIYIQLKHIATPVYTKKCTLRSTVVPSQT